MFSKPFAAALAAAVVGGFVLAQATNHAPQRPPLPPVIPKIEGKSPLRVISPAEAAGAASLEQEIRRATGGADLRANNPFAR